MRNGRRHVAWLGLGCVVWTSPACSRPAPPSARAPDFSREVAPIVLAHCAPCHRPGEVAPFSLLTYADAKAHADAIADATLAGQMPPWLPEPTEFAIAGDRRLRADHVEVIQRWVAAGAPEGDPALLPPAPTFPDGWQLGAPDLVVRPAKAFRVEPGGDDLYRNLVAPSPITSPVFVRAVEVRTHGAPIHHAVVRVDRTSASRRRDGEDGRPGFEGMASGSIQDPDGQFLGWAPGRGPIVVPEGMPWRLERGADLVIEVHVVSSPEAAAIQPSVALYFSPVPPVRTPVVVKMGSKQIDLPPGVHDQLVADRYRLPVAVDLVSVYPHAHYLARDMRITMTPPGGAPRTILHIPEWDFHWQQDYRFVSPIPMPAGTEIAMLYTFDNTASNPHNPRRPPVRVRAGPRAVDEMAELGLQLVTASAADARLLVQEFAARDLRANIAMIDERLRETPDDASLRSLMGVTLVEAERFAEAIPHLQRAVALLDRTAATFQALGVALAGTGQASQAVPPLRRAAALAPRDETIQYNLGNVLAELGRPADADAAYRRALGINPDYPEAHVNLAVLLSSKGRINEALAHYARALEIRPQSPAILANYGGALASAGRFPDALRYTRRALDLDPANPTARENLQKLLRLGVR
jgi:Flp pilus assembly protein TadD